MQQYFEIKSRYPECLLFYRMGDFYELFFEDAVTASSILDIALTKRGKNAGEDIPMCGVPVVSSETYLPKLIASGHKIAICEQLETPEEAKKRGYKEVVRRDVVRIVTPGTVTEESLLAPASAHYLAAIALPVLARHPGLVPGSPSAHSDPSSSAQAKNHGVLREIPGRARDDGPKPAAVAWLDLTTGEFTTSATNLTQLPALLARIQPKEMLLTQAAYDGLKNESWFLEWRDAVSIRPDVQFTPASGQRRLAEHFKVASAESFGEFSTEEFAACGALVDYVQLTQLDASARLDAPKREYAGDCLLMDGATRRNLELTHTLAGARRGSLLATIDETVTAAGSRALASWLSAPLAKLDPIRARHEAIDWALAQSKLREALRDKLKAIADMERAIGRLALGRGGPRDLLLLATSLTQTNALNEQLRTLELPPLLREARDALTGHHALAEHLSSALKTEVGVFARDGNFIADGFRADLDEYRRLRDESKRVIAAMETKLKADTAIPSLKIKHNNVIGYFIEITAIHEKKVPIEFIHRQGLAGALRYTTSELNDTALKIEQSADKALKLELQLFDELRFTTLERGKEIVAAARALAIIDCVLALATLAERERWVRPDMRAGTEFSIEKGRHPVVEAALRRAHEEFIANDCVLGVVSESGAAGDTSPLAGEATRLSPTTSLAHTSLFSDNVCSDVVGVSRSGEGAMREADHLRAPLPNPPRKGEGTPPAAPSSLNDRRFATTHHSLRTTHDSSLLLLTGPNMGGKSTFLRQQAILTILAQMGSFVPAQSATIGLVDKLFCRVGAADDLARGQSTFMVEMVETASILHQATSRSLVVLDEIGRGTATYDGVSVAWAVAEHLHNVTKCRALFATHYHELTALAQTLPRLKNFHATAKEHAGQLIFLHTIREGFADKSYGIHVAALAGMPKPVLTRARELLTTLESGHSLTEQFGHEALPLFAAVNVPSAPQNTAEKPFKTEPAHKLIERIASTNINALTPLEALNLLHEFHLEALAWSDVG